MQLDLDEDDLSNTTLDMYIREGYNRTIQLERRWPFFETSWSVTSNGDLITVPSTVAGISSLVDIVTNVRLLQIGSELAEDKFYGEVGTGVPAYYTWWGSTLTLYPTPESNRGYTIRGWRKPLDWVASGPNTQVDADSSLHLPIFHYACSLAYAQIEDVELENAYMRRWAATAEQAHQN
ncbi:MAG: hypothetical protein ACO4A3_07805, partial [Ilumatobacteraceae bacterium]